MITFTDFTPSQLSIPPFSFRPTLDGQICTASFSWNVFGQRWYMSLSDVNGNLILYTALVGSAIGLAIEALVWQSWGQVTVTTTAPHGYAIGATLNLTIAGVTPSGFNGLFSCLITGPDTFTFALATDPGSVSALGEVQYNVNLVAGYFTTSTLVYREPNRQFEVTP